MIELTNDQKRILNESGVIKTWQITVYDDDGPAYTIPTSNMVEDSISIREPLCTSETLDIGACESAVFSIKLADLDATAFKGRKISVTLSASHDSTSVVLDMGTYWVDDVTHPNNTWYYQLTAYDSMIKFDVKAYQWYSTLSWPMTLLEFRTQLCSFTGVATNPGQVLPLDDLVLKKHEDLDVNTTCRQLLHMIAEINGCFCRINRNGQLVFVQLDTTSRITLSEGGENSYKDGSTHENWSTNPIDAIIAYSLSNEQGVIYPPDGGTNARVIGDNVLCYDMTDNELTQVARTMYNALNGVTYSAHNTHTSGRPWLEPGDRITLDSDGQSIGTYILDRTLTGFQVMQDSLSARAVDDRKNDRSSTRQQIERLKRNTDDIRATYLKADIAEITYASIENLNATNIRVTNLEAENLVVAGKLTAAEANIISLQADKADITDLNAATARIGMLESGVAYIDTLMFGSATGTSIQTSFANAVVAQLGNAQIKDAMIESIAASKISAGSIYTNRVRIYGDSTNKLSIVDNTISISDGTRVRVQIGKDASNDYNIYVWNSAGKLMFDAAGLTADGVTRKIIRDDVVQDNANISASKLDIDSLFSVVNSDGSHTLKSSKIKLDEQNQTLDVAFTSLSSTVTSQGSTISSQGTSISVIQGQISSKIWQQDINTAVDGVTQTMNTKYATLTQSINGVRSEVGAVRSDLADNYMKTADMNTAIDQTAERISLEANARLEATVGYSSKNVLAITANTLTDGGLTFTVNKEAGTVKVNGTCTAENYKTFVVGTITNTGSGDVKYYLSGCANGGASDKYYLYAIDSTTGNRPKQWDGITTSLSSYNLSDQVEILIPSGNTVQIRILVRNGQTLNNLVFKPMVRDGSISDKTFEPYESIQTQITDTNSRITQTADSITSEVSKRIKATVGHSDDNLFVYNKSTQTINGITFTIDKDAETIKASGTATADAIIYFTIPSTVYGNLYFSGCPDGGSSSTWDVYCWDDTASARPKKWDGTTSSASCYNKNQAEEIKLVNGHTSVLAIRIRSGKTVSNLVFEPSITKNKSLQADVYETNSKITQTADSITSEVNKKVNTADLQANYSTTERMNSTITTKANEISLKVCRSTITYSKNKICPSKFTGKPSSPSSVTLTDSTGTVKFTATGVWQAYNYKGKSLGLIDGHTYVVTFKNNSANSVGKVAYRNSSNVIVNYVMLSTTGDKSFEFTFSDAGGFISVLATNSDTTSGSVNITNLMIRDKDITDSTFVAYVDNSSYLCSQISMTDEQISLTSGRLLITSGNFTLDSSGTATMTNAVLTGGSITSGNYQSNTSGMKIQLSNGTIDSKNFKVSSTGVVTATSATLNSCSIAGGTIQSTNYDTDEGTGMKIALSSGAISTGSGKFSVSSAGALTAKSGTIGGWTINADSISQNKGGYVVSLSSSSSTSSTADVLSCTDSSSNNKTLSIRRDGRITIGANTFQQMRLEAGHIDFYYNNTYSGRLGQTSNNEISIENTGLYIEGSVAVPQIKINRLASSSDYQAVGVAMQMTLLNNVDTLTVGMSEYPLRIACAGAYIDGYLNFYKYNSSAMDYGGITFGSKIALRYWASNESFCVGISDKKLQFYGTNVLMPSGAAVTSDARKKHSIESLDSRYLDVIKNIEPSRFKYNDNPDRYHTGFIAQEVLSAMTRVGLRPEEFGAFVDINGDGSDYALRYGEFAAMLLLYIKDLESQIQTIKGGV